MEDRFKFRVWCKNKKEWEKNDPFIHYDGTLYSWHNNHLKPYSLDNHVIMQCTGLKDKYGVLIYEEDVVQVVITSYKNGKVLSTENCHVAYQKGCLGLIHGHNREFTIFSGFSNTVSFEIIGNIHLNPELLEG